MNIVATASTSPESKDQENNATLAETQEYGSLETEAELILRTGELPAHLKLQLPAFKRKLWEDTLLLPFPWNPGTAKVVRETCPDFF